MLANLNALLHEPGSGGARAAATTRNGLRSPKDPTGGTRSGASIKGILVTGHSLGAGQAVVAALDLATLYPAIPVTMYTFGTPRVGDAAHAKAIRDQTNLATFVIAHRADAEPRCPNLSTDETPHPLRNYSSCHTTSGDRRHQVGRGVWYPDGLAPVGPEGYVLCDGTGEDETCIDGVDERFVNCYRIAGIHFC